jgi:hypothetical protein
MEKGDRRTENRGWRWEKGERRMEVELRFLN